MRVVVAGAGETGLLVADQLSKIGHDVIMIDRDSQRLANAEDILDVQTLHGEATSRRLLRTAECHRATGIVTVTNNGNTNLLAAALGRSLGAKVAVARVDDPALFDTELGVERDVLGVDYVFCPPRMAVLELVRQLTATEAVLVESFADHLGQMALLTVGEDVPAEGRAPGSLPADDEAFVAAIVRDGRVRPAHEIPRIETEDGLVLVGTGNGIARAARRLTAPRGPRRLLVVGAGETGVQLARALALNDDRVLLLDSDAERCAAAAELLPDVKVLRGDGTNVAFLRDVRVDAAEALFAVTSDDEVNLMVSLLARQSGVRHAFISVHRPGYADLYQQLGVGGTVGTYDVLARAATNALVQARLLPRATLPGTGYAVVEYRLPEAVGSGRPLSELPVPAAALILAVIRGGAVLPPAEFIEVCGGDDLLLAMPARSVDRFDAVFQKEVAR